MATITPTVTQGGPCRVITWANAATVDTIVAAKFDQPIKAATLQVQGTFGGATVALQGSIDGTNFHTLLDHEGNALSKTAAGIDGLRTSALEYKPSITGGTADSITITLAIWH